MGIEGNWQLDVQSPMGMQHFTLSLQESAGSLTGTLTNNENQLTADIFEGSVSGDELGWKVTLKQLKMTLTFQTTVTGDAMDGKVKAGFLGKFNVSGKREPAATG